ncbi:hypothetical protein B0H15DRAFT_747888, partial [Mycena belliarum]
IANKAERLSDLERLGLLRYYNTAGSRVHFPLDPNPTANTSPLASHAETYNFALLDGRRITPTSRARRNNAGSSIIQARIGDERHAGEIRNIFIHRQEGIPDSSQTVLAAIEWMKRSEFTPLDVSTFIWDDFPELGVETWELDIFIDPHSNYPPIIMPLADVHCQLCRGRIIHTEPQLWMTATMDR